MTSTSASPRTRPASPISKSARPSRASFRSNDGRLTVEEWARLPETKPHYELVDGLLKQKMPTRSSHSHAAFRLALQLALWGDSRGFLTLTEGIGIKTDAFNGFVPDMMMFAPETHPRPDAVYVDGAFLVAEILSPSTAKDDRTTKMDAYARAEVEIYLLIDATKKTVEVYRLDSNSYGAPEILTENATWTPNELEGLQLQLSSLWMPVSAAPTTRKKGKATK